MCTPPSVTCSHAHRNACISCGCVAAGALGSGSQCDVSTGQCACRAGTTGRTCNVCKRGFYGLSASNPTGCLSCECNLFGTVNGSTSCDPTSGQCQCLPSNVGRTCSQCVAGFFQLPLASSGVCAACDAQCSSLGCYGAGNSVSSCIQCRNVQFNGVCLESCPVNMFAGTDGICRACDSQCAGGCTGKMSSVTMLMLV
jgi:hypothetical protein